MSKNSLPLLILLGLVLFVAAAFLMDTAGVFDTNQGQVRRVYFADNISSTHRDVIERFNQRYRGNIEVVPVNLPFTKFSTNERKELLARSLRNKSDRIDIFAVDQIWVSRFSKWGDPMDHYLSDEERQNVLGYALESCFADSVLVALPLYIDIGLMYYRRDALRNLPDREQVEARLRESMTWDEFVALRDRLRLKGEPYYLFQADDFEGLVCNYFELCAGQDRRFFARNTVDLKSPVAGRALQMLVDFVHRHGLSPPAVAEFDEIRSYQYLLDRKGVFVRGWPNFLEDYREFYRDTIDVNQFGRAALPHFAGQDPVSVFGGWNLMVSRNSTQKEAAREFIRFLQTEEIQKFLFESGGYIPVSATVYADSAYMAAHPNLVYYRHLLDSGFHRPAMAEYTQISDIISHFAHRAIKGEMTVQEALARASSMIESNQVLIK